MKGWQIQPLGWLVLTILIILVVTWALRVPRQGRSEA